MKVAPTDLGGVRQLLKALKRGRSSACCRIKCPATVSEWTMFFGRPAYTMTLVGRMLEAAVRRW